MKVGSLSSIFAGPIIAIGLVFGSCSVTTSYAYTEIDVSNGGNITGTVTFNGDVPAVQMLNVNKDTQVCGHGTIPSEALTISSNKGIKDAVISIENIEKGKKFDTSGSNPALDQKNCVFTPHILAITAGATVDILNSDSLMHNVHSFAIKNPRFNLAITKGRMVSRRFDAPEAVRIKCDVHHWMSCYIVVKDNPYFAVTDENGNYKIDNVPPGTYKLQVWQEILGRQQKDVTVEAGKDVIVDFKLAKK